MGIFNSWNYDTEDEKKKKEELLACLEDSSESIEENKAEQIPNE